VTKAQNPNRNIVIFSYLDEKYPKTTLTHGQDIVSQELLSL